MKTETKTMAKAKAKKNSQMIRTKDSLSELIDSGKFISYVDKVADERCEDVHWTILGDCRYNLLWIVVSNVVSGEQAIECIPSLSPRLGDNITEMDLNDAGLALAHSDNMWKKHKGRLTK